MMKITYNHRWPWFYKFLFAMLCLAIVMAYLAFWGGILYVVYHFIAKFW